MRPRIGITLGDPHGIGPELALQLLADPRLAQQCQPVLYGPADALIWYRKHLALDGLAWHLATDATPPPGARPTLVDTTPGFGMPTPGTPTTAAGAAALDALNRATNDLAAGQLDALLTLPIDKHTIHSSEFPFAGHTEFLQEKFGAPDVLMLLVHEALRVAVVTTHIPVRAVADALTPDRIVSKLRLMDASLRGDFGILHPRLAVLGLNPHAGDNGLIGTEEQTLVMPAIAAARQAGLDAAGPFPADGFFAMGAFRGYDGILAMYHDQGLIPFKTLAQGFGVNFTAGLPIVRTSPDHGTAYDIAGKGIADATSTWNALTAACTIWQARLTAAGSTSRG